MIAARIIAFAGAGFIGLGAYVAARGRALPTASVATGAGSGVQSPPKASGPGLFSGLTAIIERASEAARAAGQAVQKSAAQLTGKAMTYTDEDLQWLARTVWGEAASEPYEGQLAVAHVILNRVRDRKGQWPNTIREVVTQRRQFDVWDRANPRYLATSTAGPHSPGWSLSQRAARDALEGVADPTGGAFIYFNDRTATNTAFTDKVKSMASKALPIGQHTFFLGVR